MFWARFEKLALRAANLIEKTPFPDVVVQKEIEFRKSKHMVPVSVKSVQEGAGGTLPPLRQEPRSAERDRPEADGPEGN